MEDFPFPLRPREVFEEVRKTVVGQDDAIREISVALVKHLVGHIAPNILLIGNSGSGKTTLMRAVEQFLAGRPDLNAYANVVRINANVLAEERQGYGRAVLGRLFANAKHLFGSDSPPEVLLGCVEHGIVVFDLETAKAKPNWQRTEDLRELFFVESHRQAPSRRRGRYEDQV